ncbi:MAG: hypothetical protein MJ149_03100, partial [Clostridia bacterium]|nr:hypothetical protein [Clostridia bacterium]
DAKKYLEYKEILKQHEINSYIFQYDNAERMKQEINTKLAGYKDNLNIAQESFEAEQAKYDKTFNEISSLDGESNALRDKIMEKRVALQKYEGDSQLLDAQTKHIKDELDRLNKELDAYNLDLNQRTVLLNAARASYEEQSLKLNQLNLDSQTMSDKYMTLVDEITKSEGEKEKNQRAMLDNISKITDIKANLSAYMAKRDAMLENIKNDTERLNKLLAEQETLKQEIAKYTAEVETLQNNKQTTENEIAHFTEKLTTLQGAIAALNDEIYAIKTAISNDANRKTILSNLQADFEGYQFAVKRLLQDGKTNARLSSAIKGVVGTIIDVEPKFQTAIEIA